MSPDIQEVAYVLKRFLPQRQKVALLTQLSGRITAVVMQRQQCLRLWPGMVITCSLYRENVSWIMRQSSVTVVHVPQNYPHIIWLHHILELCYYFLPLESPCIDVFFYLKNCYAILWRNDALEEEIQPIVVRICVVKLLSMFGFYAQEDIEEYLSLFQEISDVFIDFSDKQKVNFLKQKLLLLNAVVMDIWILDCLKSHPRFQSLKTVAFNYSS